MGNTQQTLRLTSLVKMDMLLVVTVQVVVVPGESGFPGILFVLVIIIRILLFELCDKWVTSQLLD